MPEVSLNFRDDAEKRQRQAAWVDSPGPPPRALSALDHIIGVYDRLKPVGFSYRRLEMHADDGYLFGHLAQHDDDYDALRILRSTLHNTMLDACAEQPDLIQVRYSARLTHIEDGEDGVIIRSEDGSSARGDILIGADGIHSKVREHVLGPMAPTPTFLGSCMINSILPLSSIKAPSDWNFPAAIFTPPHNHGGSEVAWYVSEDLPDKDRAAWREYGTSGAAARAAEAHYASSTALGPALDAGIPTWHRGRVCLIGDAAHALPPNGQGSAMAFEDAAYLSRLLSSEKAPACGFERVFAQFELDLVPAIRGIEGFVRAAPALCPRPVSNQECCDPTIVEGGLIDRKDC
ncbi:hypothetical protein B0H12DRAFT_1310448 [Mycena haematopus]|nr:hypothetical protein B0H12DRAFT_1310448 [Mycena haematopus]